MDERRHIRLLPVAVANKIAAGEVVERPASVVKEFMENAFDAGASRIEVSVVSGGRKLISVADNGCGMDRDDALMCLEPQATSKIRDVDDIERITTYGFRGEAVPSVAAVSRMVLRTATADGAPGTCVEVDGGKIRSVADVGFPAGTTFEIRDLFFNVPARRKFLKSFGTEQAHVRQVFTLQALAHPETTLKLKADGRDVLALAGGASLLERVHDLFGSEFMDALRPVDFKSPEVSVSGFIGLPSLTRSDRAEQYVFVNRRAATAAVIPFALREAYPPLEGDRKPVAILFIEVPPTEVDVNVHPTKREVRFRDARAVRDALILAVQKALGLGSFGNAVRADANAAPDFAPASSTACGAPLPAETPSPCGGAAPCGGAPSIPAPAKYTPPPAPVGLPLPSASTSPRMPFLPPSPPSVPSPAPVAAAPAASNPAPGNGLWAWCRLLGQIGGGYVLLETDGGYVVLDPRAAHERILYERMLGGALGGTVASQPLLMPETVTLPPEDADRIGENLANLNAMGFSIDTFGDNTFIVEALPAGIKLGEIRPVLADISRGIAESGAKRGAADWKLKAAAQAAATSAVSRMAAIPYQALAALVEDLACAKMPYTSPRGRPTMFFTSTRELDRKFGVVK